MARISIAWHDVTWRCMVWYCISNEWRCMAWGGIALHGMARYGVAWNGTGLHCTGCTCMVLHFMSWCDIAWHGLAVLIVHTHCCWVSRFGVLPRRAITLFVEILCNYLNQCPRLLIWCATFSQLSLSLNAINAFILNYSESCTQWLSCDISDWYICTYMPTFLK